MKNDKHYRQISVRGLIQTLVCGMLASLLRPAAATDLKETYQMAMEHDAQYRQVVATDLATREQKPQAWSRLMPQISLSAGTSLTETAANGGFN